MPFGKHKGTPMQDVPASYFHWLWTQTDFSATDKSGVADYIKRNFTALKQEHNDGIW